MRLEQQRYAEAEAPLREALDRQEKRSLDTWERYDCESMLGASLAGQGKYGDAEPLLLSGFQGLSTREATIPESNRVALEQAGERIVLLYEAWGRPEEAADWRNRLRRP
jgi:non-specific serine/threonine protein kinase/serine/threonine-protein kinase